ncbi:MAG: efflux RND transporter periplasmic adaptor subunit [Burkholderiales bacterium]
MKIPWTRIALATAVAAAAIGFVWLRADGDAEAARFRLARLERGPLTAVIVASGTLNAVATVQVVSPMSGQVKEIYADFNSPVKENQILARFDPASVELRVNQARADRDAAQRELAAEQAGLDAPQAGFDKARIRTAKARVKRSQAVLKQRESLLGQANVDLERTVVRAPVDGTVILRNVDAGQTVAASAQLPTLFTIARDLHDMQVESAVDEADVGRLRTGQRATFTVDAFPRRSFSGEIVRIRKPPASVHGIVSPTVVISVRNADLALLPGMKANVSVVVDQRDDALKVPNAALLFRPPGAAGPAAGCVWVLSRGAPQPVELRLGLSDGTATEVVSGPLAAGDEVIVGLTPAEKRDSFLPRMRLFE